MGRNEIGGTDPRSSEARRVNPVRRVDLTAGKPTTIVGGEVWPPMVNPDTKPDPFAQDIKDQKTRQQG